MTSHASTQNASAPMANTNCLIVLSFQSKLRVDGMTALIHQAMVGNDNVLGHD
jgi:hypothetical protein